MATMLIKCLVVPRQEWQFGRAAVFFAKSDQTTESMPGVVCVERGHECGTQGAWSVKMKRSQQQAVKMLALASPWWAKSNNVVIRGSVVPSKASSVNQPQWER